MRPIKQYRTQGVYSEKDRGGSGHRVFIMRTIQAVKITGCLLWERYKQYRLQGVYCENSTNSTDHSVFTGRTVLLNVNVSCNCKEFANNLIFETHFKEL